MHSSCVAKLLVNIVLATTFQLQTSV